MKNNAPNDWFLAVVENPTMNLSDFETVGLNTENTALKDKEFYKSNSYVRELYTTNGKFDETKFNEHYDIVAQSYQAFTNKQYVDSAMSDMSFDPYNTMRPEEGKTKPDGFNLIRHLNPLHESYSFGGIGSITPSELSTRELMQKSNIFDWDKQQFENYSPNDVALEKNLIGYVKSLWQPLVQAQYEEDGVHQNPFTGQMIAHKKGDLKINDEGEFYYETLGSRSAYGKQFKSIFDTLTVDGSTLNTYDFFDSDGLDKSVTSTVAKVVATVAPLFTPLAPYYGWALVGAQLFDIAPTLFNITVGNFTETPQFLNHIQGIGKSLKGSVSDYSQKNLVTVENLGTILSDVALQWQQQVLISKGVGTLLGNNKIQKQIADEAAELAVQKTMNTAITGGTVTEATLGKNYNAAIEILSKNKLKPLLDSNNRTAANAAMGYMAAMQGFQSYEDALAIGASKTEASAIAWGTVLGMYGIMRTGLGETFFPELQSAEKIAARKATSPLIGEMKKALSTFADAPKQTKLKNLMGKAKEISNKYWQDVQGHSLTFVQKAFTEGLEEVSEELVADFVKQTYNLFTDLGVTSTKNKFKFDDALARYGMSFLGGSLGGAVFGGVEIVNTIKSKPINQELTYLLRNQQKHEILSELDKMRKRGMLGNTTLSATDYYTDSDGKREYKTAKNSSDSQNEYVYNMLVDYINQLDRAINQEEINYSDEDVLDKLVRSNDRLAGIQKAVGKDGVTGRYLQDFNTLGEELTSASIAIDNYRRSIPDTEKNDPKHIEEISRLEKVKSNIIDKRNKYLSDENSLEYVDKLLFEIDDNVNKAFYLANFQQYVEGTTGKKISDFNESNIERLKEKWEIYKGNSTRDSFDDAYTIFKTLNKAVIENVNSTSNSYDEYAHARQIVLEAFIDPEKTQEKYGQYQSFDDIPHLLENDPNIHEVFKDNIDLNDTLQNIQNIADLGFVDIFTKNVLSKYLLNQYESVLRNSSELFTEEYITEYIEMLDDYDGIKNLEDFIINFDGIVKDISTLDIIENIFINYRSLNNLQNNPLFEFLQKISVSTYQSDLNIISLLNRENSDLAKVGYQNYIINSAKLEEVEEALHVLDIADSLINAADSTPLSDSRLFGHNAIINDHIDYLKLKSDKLGVVRSDLAQLMREDIKILRDKLNFIKQLSLLNQANTLKETENTGKNINKLLGNILKCKDRFEVLKDINIDDQYLFEGIEAVQTPNLDSFTTPALSSNEITIDVDVLSGVINSNYQKMLDGKSVSERMDIQTKLVKQIINVVTSGNIDNLSKQKFTNFNSKTESLTDYDIIVYLVATLALSRPQFNKPYLSVLKNNSGNIVPIYPQEHSIYIGVAMLENPNLFKTLINNIPLGKGSEDLIQLYNTLFINGVGGSGKTSALITRILQIYKSLHPDTIIWGSAPKETQLRNLNIDVSEKLAIDKLLEKILGDINYAQLKLDLNKVEELNTDLIVYDDSPLFSINEELVDDSYIISNKKLKNISYKSFDHPNLIVIDEATYIDTISAMILSDWAVQNGVHLIFSGDTKQQGYYKRAVQNISPRSVLTVRIPPLTTSLRVSNIQKKSNNDISGIISTYVDGLYPDEINFSEVVEYTKSIFKDNPFQYLSSENIPLDGDKLIDSIENNYELIGNILSSDSCKDLIYIYDDSDKKISVQSYIESNFPEFKSKVQYLTLDSVQGLESTHTIIDLNFDNNSLDNLLSVREFITKFNTAITRAKNGSVIVNNGLTKIIPFKTIESKYPAETPNLSKVLESYTAARIELLEKSSSIASPTIIPSVITVSLDDKQIIIDNVKSLITDINNLDDSYNSKEEDINNLNQILNNLNGDIIQEELVKLTTQYSNILYKYNNFVQSQENLKNRKNEIRNKLTQDRDKVNDTVNSDEKSLLIIDIDTFYRNINSYTDIDTLNSDYNILSNKIFNYLQHQGQNPIPDKNQETKQIEEFLNNPNPEQDKENLPPIDGDIRVYTFYQRIGQETESTIEDTFIFGNTENGRIAHASTINFISSKSSKWDILAGELKKLNINNSEKFVDSLKNGEFYISVTKTNNSTTSNNGYNQGFSQDQIIENGYIYKLEYRFTHPNGKTGIITIGTLPKIKTLKDNKVSNSEGYIELIESLKRSGTELMKIDDSWELTSDNFTNLWKTDEYGLEKFKELNPGCIISPVFIWADSSNFFDEKNHNGRACVYASTKPTITYQGQEYQLTEDNLHSWYTKLKSKKEKGAPIRCILLDCKGIYCTDHFNTITTPSGAKERTIISRGFFDLHQSDAIDERDSHSKFSQSNPVGNGFTGIRMFGALWNYRNNLQRVLDILEDNKGDIEKTNKKLDALNESNVNNKEAIIYTRLLPEGKRSNFDSGYWNIPVKYLEFQLQLLNNLIDVITSVTTLDENGKDSGMKTILPPTSITSFINIDRESLSGTSSSSLFTTGAWSVYELDNGKIIQNNEEAITSLDSSHIVPIILSAYYKMVNQLDGFDYTTYSKYFSPVGLLDITPEGLGEYMELKYVPGIKHTQSGFISNLFNFIFHGNVNPYAVQSGNIINQNAPFPNGIYFHPRFKRKSKQSKSTEQKEYVYLAANNVSNFTCNVLVQNSFMRLSKKDVESNLPIVPEVDTIDPPEQTNIVDSYLKLLQDENFAGKLLQEWADNGDCSFSIDYEINNTSTRLDISITSKNNTEFTININNIEYKVTTSKDKKHFSEVQRINNSSEQQENVNENNSLSEQKNISENISESDLNEIMIEVEKISHTTNSEENNNICNNQ